MNLIKYVPEACKGKGTEYSGHVMLKPLTFDQRFEYAEELNLEITDGGEVDIPKNKIRLVRKMVSMSQRHYESVHITRKVGDEVIEYKSFDDLSVDSDATGILVDVATKVMQGFRPTKK